MSLRWEMQRDRESWYAYSGRLVVGMVVKRSTDGRYAYSVGAVHTKWIAKGHGAVKSASSAKRAVDRAWSAWLEVAGLQPLKDPLDTLPKSVLFPK